MPSCANKPSSVGANPTPSADATVSDLFYSVDEIAARWKVSRDFVRRLFEREAGVLVFGNSPPHGKRRYRTLRVPKDVLLRVERRNSVVVRFPKKEGSTP